MEEGVGGNERGGEPCLTFLPPPRSMPQATVPMAVLELEG